MSEALPEALDALDNIFLDIVESTGVDVGDLTEEDRVDLKNITKDMMKELDLESLVTQLVIGTYDVPVYSHPDLQREMINETENKMFGGCYQGYEEELSRD